MNQADKQEALRLVEEIATHAYTSSDFADRAKQCADLRALIERQNDTDGEMWRFCVGHGFPVVGSGGACATYNSIPFICDTPAEAVQAAMAAMKGKA